MSGWLSQQVAGIQRLSVNGQNLGVRQRISKAIEIEKRPDHLLVAIYFNQLRIPGTRVAVIDQDISTGQNLKRCYPRELYPGQVILMKAPDCLTGRSHLQNAMPISCPDQCIAARKPNGREALIAKRFDAMPARRFAIKQRNLKLPCRLPVR